MATRNLSFEEALELCTRQEDHFFDRKAFEIAPAKIERIAVAFANADGGEFVVGICDEKAEPDTAHVAGKVEHPYGRPDVGVCAVCSS